VAQVVRHIDEDIAVRPVKKHDECQTDCDLSHRQPEHEEREHLPEVAARETRERDEVQIVESRMPMAWRRVRRP
jgi:hypothetical protein